MANDWYQKSDCGKNSYFDNEEIKQISNHIPVNCIIGAKRILQETDIYSQMKWIIFVST